MNAKNEFIYEVGDKEVLCARISYGDSWNEEDNSKTVLTKGHTSEHYDRFLDSLDFDYNNGYGGQNLFGIIWYKDGTWSSRGEYDGSEWWEHHQVPSIPSELL